MSKLDQKIKELVNRHKKTNVKIIEQQISQELGISIEVVKLYTEALSETIGKQLNDLPGVKTLLEQLNEEIKKLQGPVELKDVDRLVPTGKVIVENLGDISFPKAEKIEFPQKIQAEILKAVDTFNLRPETVTIQTDINDYPRLITEQYERFSVVTEITRRPSGSIERIKTIVKKR